MNTNKKPTIKSVAEKAGVSTATVSYVINGGPRQVNRETRDKVLAAIAELDFQPNAAARSLANRKTDTIGLVLAGLAESSFSSSHFFEYLKGISFAAESKGYNLLLFGNHSGAADPQFYKQLARSNATDGLILLGSSIPDDNIVDLFERGLPSVLLGRDIPGRPVHAVHQDYEAGAYEATRHLCLSGYRRIGFFGQALRFSYGLERLEGYKRALKDCGRDFDPRLADIPDTPRDDPAEKDVQTMIAREPRVDAVLTDRGLSVLNLIRASGRRIPEDVAVVCLDEGENSQFFDPPLTTLRAPKFELGAAALDLVVELIDGDRTEPRKKVLPMQFVLRESCPPRLDR